MKFTVSCKELEKAIVPCSRVAGKNANLVILENLKFDIENGAATITGTDLEITIMSYCKVTDLQGHGSFCIQSKLLIETITKLAEQPLEFELKDNSIVITAFQGKYTFPIANSNEFPVIKELTNTIKVNTKSDNILHGLNKTINTMSSDELRPAMCGTFFEFGDGMITTSTDAHKLVSCKVCDESFSVGSFILPKTACSIIKGSLVKDTDVEILFNDKNVRFIFPGFDIICRLSEGKYPNYRGVIPTEQPFKCIVSKNSLSESLKRISIFANKVSNLVRLEFSENKIELLSQDIDFSISAKESIVCNYNGDKMAIGMNSGNLSTLINNIHGENIDINFQDPSRAIIILPSEEPLNIISLLMPMILND